MVFKDDPLRRLSFNCAGIRREPTIGYDSCTGALLRKVSIQSRDGFVLYGTHLGSKLSHKAKRSN